VFYRRNPQLNKNGELIHLLSIEGLPKATLTHILDTAANFVSVSDREVKKVMSRRMYTSSMPVTAAMPTRRRGCWTCTRYGTTKKTSATSR